MRILIFLMLFISSSIAQAVTINFKAHNRNGYPLPLKSVQIIHEGGGLDTTLTQEPFEIDLSGFVTDVNDGVQDDFYVSKAYPNSFEERTQFNVSIPQSRFTSVEIVSARGDIVAESSSYLSAGNYTYTFEGGGLPAGIYLARISSGSHSETLKLVKAASGGGNMGTLSYWGNSVPKLEVKDYGGFKFIGRVAGSPEAVIDSAVIKNGQEIDFEIDTDTEWAFSVAEITFHNISIKEDYISASRHSRLEDESEYSKSSSGFYNDKIVMYSNNSRANIMAIDTRPVRETINCNEYFFQEDSIAMCQGLLHYKDFYSYYNLLQFHINEKSKKISNFIFEAEGFDISFSDYHATNDKYYYLKLTFDSSIFTQDNKNSYGIRIGKESLSSVVFSIFSYHNNRRTYWDYVNWRKSSSLTPDQPEDAYIEIKLLP